MCIIAVLNSKTNLIQRKQADITKATLRNCWNENPDGAGYMYVKDIGSDSAEVVVNKGFMKFKFFYKSFRISRENNPDSNFVCHFRIASKGSVNASNTHPFYVYENKSLAIAHNGTLPLGSAKVGESDTKIFATNILSKLPGNFYLQKSFQYLLNRFIGKDKVVFLDSLNQVIILNSDLGYGDLDTDIAWFSNCSYKTYNRRNVTEYLNGNEYYDPHQAPFTGDDQTDLFNSPRNTYEMDGDYNSRVCSISGCHVILARNIEKIVGKCSKHMTCSEHLAINQYYGIRECKNSNCKAKLYPSLHYKYWQKGFCPRCESNSDEVMLDEILDKSNDICDVCKCILVSNDEKTHKICKLCMLEYSTNRI